jgi:hypothetical protein
LHAWHHMRPISPGTASILSSVASIPLSGNYLLVETWHPEAREW